MALFTWNKTQGDIGYGSQLADAMNTLKDLDTTGFTNLSLTTPVLSGTVTGTYTLDGAVSIDNPILVGITTGTYTLGGTPTIASPTITGTVVTGGAVSTTGGASKLLKSDGSGNLTLTGGLTTGNRLTVNYEDTGTAITNGGFRFNAVSDYGSSKNIFYHRQDANQIVINEDGQDLSFRVESLAGGNSLSVDGTTGIVRMDYGLTTGLPTYSDQSAATGGGLTAGDMYKTATGEVRIVV